MRNRVYIFAVVSFVLFIGLTVQAQSSMSVEKRRLIGEIIGVMKMESLTQQLTDEMLKGMETSFPIGYGHAVESNPSLTSKQKEQFIATQNDVFTRISTKFRDRMRTEIDYKKYIEESVYPLYDKFFTEQELSDLIQFYKSPTGQKVINTMPEVFAESQKLAQEKLLPQILPIITELVEEEFSRVSGKSPRKEIIEAVPAKRRKTK
ncbi:MAG: DUF2059 domain-containing protein [Pyrinomonadaceae bacterium]